MSPADSQGSPSGALRILVVSQMYPGPEAEDLGTFVAQVSRELSAQGHTLAHSVIDHRRRSRAKYAVLVADAVREARRFRPDVVYGHMLFPAGAAAALAAAAARAPFVLTAHGTDVSNVARSRAVAVATDAVCRRAARVIAVSDYLRRQLEESLPRLRGRIDVIDSGVDLTRFQPRAAEDARRALGWDGEGPRYLFLGSLDERKNIARLLAALDSLPEGRLAVLGAGPSEDVVRRHPRVRLVGRRPHAEVAQWMAACDVLCQPTLVEAFGQAILEAMASGRSVVATSVGGPPEFVTPACGVLVDPLDVQAIALGMQTASRLPRPNLEARAAAAAHDVRLQAGKIAAVLADAAARPARS